MALSGKRLVWSLCRHTNLNRHTTLNTRLTLKFLNEQTPISLQLLLYPEINEQSKELKKALLLNHAHNAETDSEAATLNKQEECHTSVSSSVASHRDKNGLTSCAVGLVTQHTPAEHVKTSLYHFQTATLLGSLLGHICC